MKFKQLVLFISFIFIYSVATSQTFSGGIKYLFYQVINVAPPNDIKIEIDSMYIIKSINDTIVFETVRIRTPLENKKRFVKKANKISCIKSGDTIVLYDFGLQVGDTFNMSITSKNYTLTLDSIKTIRLQNAIDYKHLFLHNITNQFPVVWVENLGEKYFGWDYTSFNQVDIPEVVAVCSDTLIWSKQIYLWKFKDSGLIIDWLLPDCSFHELQKRSSAEVVFDIFLRLYPNPASNEIHICVNGLIPIQSCIIYDLQGRKVKEINTEEIGNDVVIQTNDLICGCYIVYVNTEEAIYQRKLFIEK